LKYFDYKLPPLKGFLIEPIHFQTTFVPYYIKNPIKKPSNLL